MRDRPDKKRREKAKKEVNEWEQKECDSQTKGKIAAELATTNSYTKKLLEKRGYAMGDEAQTSFQQVAARGIDQYA